GRNGKPYEHLRWSDIRTTAVLNSGHDVSLLVRKPNGEEQWYDVRPKKNPESKLPLIGIGLPHKPEIEIFPPAVEHLNPQASPPLQDYDRVVEAAGQKVTSGADLMAIFAQQPRGSMPIKVERRERTTTGKPVEKPTNPPETIETVLQPKPMREFGLAMKIGPIVAVQAGSPAAKAGLQVDDRIVEIDGKSVGDPLLLSQRLTPEPGTSKTVDIVIERKDRQGKVTRKSLEVVPEPPLQSPGQMPTNPT